MRPRPCPEALAEQLFLLTLATEQALTHEDFVEAGALFDRRDQILSRLESLKLTPAAQRRLGEVQLLETEFASRLRDWRLALVDQIATAQQARRVPGAYSHTGHLRSFDRCT